MVMGLKLKKWIATLVRCMVNLRKRNRNVLFALCLIVFLTFFTKALRWGPPDDDVVATDEEIAVSVNIALSSGLGAVASSKVLPNSSTVLYQPDSLCKENGMDIFTLFMVISSPENWQARNDTRIGLKLYINDYMGMHTYQLGHARRNLLLFFTGTSSDPAIQARVEHEARMYQDMVLDAMSEGYLRLTLKTLRMLKWVRKNCPAAEFVVKIDDDVHLNLLFFFTFLESIYKIDQGRDLVGGHVQRNATPVRDPNDKWFVPMQFWPSDTYPDYISGYLYVLGKRALERIYEASLEYPIFHFEDVFVTGIIASDGLHLNLTNFPNFSYEWIPTQHLLWPTCSLKGFMAVHFRFPHWNYLRCWSRFNSRDFVCSNYWPLNICY